jgi:hypothetical protein
VGANRGRAIAYGVVTVALVAVGGAGLRWYRHLPRPTLTEVALTAPEAMEIDDKAKPNPLVLEFNRSAARIEAVGKVVATGVSLSPKVAGVWRWETDRRLTFTPKADWPIGEELTVVLAKRGLLAETVRLEDYKLPFHTAPFVASIEGTEFYQDPVDPALKKVVATVKFSHPVDADSFVRGLELVLLEKAQGGGDRRFDGAGPLKAHVTYDKLRGYGYIHSAPVAIPPRDLRCRVVLDAGIRAARGGEPMGKPQQAEVAIPGLYNFMKVQSARLAFVTNDKLESDQVLVVETSLGARSEEVRPRVSAYVLPLRPPSTPPKERKRPYNWSHAEVGQDVLNASTRVALEPIPNERDVSELHSFRYKAPVGHTLFLRVDRGVRSFGGYVLGETFVSTTRVPPFPRELKILNDGAIIALGSDRHVALYARDVEAIRFELGRVLPGQLHHLVSQVDAPFAHPDRLWEETYGSGFNQDNLAEVRAEVRQLPELPHGKPSYQSFDLAPHMGDGGQQRGLFLLKAESWDPNTNSGTGTTDARLILVTDLGIVVKDLADDSHDVYVQSIGTGDAVGGARVEVVGLNGQVVLSETTDATGHCHFPPLKDYQRDRKPTLYRVQRGSDWSFLPYDRSDRYVETSRFDVGGVYEERDADGLTAYLFSDRGIYRPGDELRLGVIVKPRSFGPLPEGLPLDVELTDPRGLTVKRERIKLQAGGFQELRHTTSDTAPTGSYTVNVYLVKDDEAGGLIGSSTVRVSEFLPDRLRIQAQVVSAKPGADERVVSASGTAASVEGWAAPAGLRGRVALQTLLGTPAAGRRVSATLTLLPALPTFRALRDYTFAEPRRNVEGVNQELPDTKTNDAGEVQFDLGLERFAAASYQLRLVVRGFEAEGGRSVAAEAAVIVSPYPLLVGYKADGDLRYIHRGSERSVHLVAVGPDGKPTAAKGLSVAVIERKYVSALTKQSNGTYKYESVKKETQLSAAPLAVGAGGLRYTLPTQTPGDFALVVRDREATQGGLDLQRIDYSVAGEGNVSRSLDRNAELKLDLAKTDVAPGEEVELSIRAPYTGAGLITVERDKVYAHRWFKADTTASVQRIRIPEEMEGGGYVSVAFVRAPSSNEIFMSPLSYGVVPFSVSRARRTAQVQLSAQERLKPGEPLTIRYKADRPTRMVVYAVDEGILQVARYKLPDPLDFFFRKRALQVRTAQILDLLLPSFGKLMEVSSTGGDDEGGLGRNPNPFKRRRDRPVAFWSGILDAGPEARTVRYVVPESFNGSLRVMGVAVSADAIGVAERRAEVRGDYVLTPNVPTFVAPGDTFDVAVTVANNVAGSGAGSTVALAVEPSAHLEVLGSAKSSLTIPEQREGTAHFRFRARPNLGSASLVFTATGSGTHRARLQTDLSVRPTTPYVTQLTAGVVRDGAAAVPLKRSLYSEYRVVRAALSNLPLGLAHGLAQYLEKYPHGCTEQLASQAVPAIVVARRGELGAQSAKGGPSAEQTFGKIVDLLRTRQNDEGGFGLWASSPASSPFASVYALHVLLDAKERGLAVPREALRRGANYLNQLVATEGDSLTAERLRAYALYVLTRGGVVTTRYATALQRRMDKRFGRAKWESDLTAAYLAATYALLHQVRAAEALLLNTTLGGTPPATTSAGEDDGESVYYDELVRNAQLLYLWSRHLPQRAQRVTAEELDALVRPLTQGSYNSLSSAYTILALDAYGTLLETLPPTRFAIDQLDGAGTAKSLLLPAGLLPSVAVAPGTKQVRFGSQGPREAFYLLAESGFDTSVPAAATRQGLEVFREYTDRTGKALTQVGLGDEIEVHLKVRSLGSSPVYDVALVDLLPGGFEVVIPPQSSASGRCGGDEGSSDAGSSEGDEGDGGEANGDGNGCGQALPIALPRTTWSTSYGDVREDRVVLYGTAPTEVKEYVYAIKPTSLGTYAVPAVTAESMYRRATFARSAVPGALTVVNKK